MAPLPKRRHSSQRSGKRQRAITLKPVLLVNCSNCGQSKKSHTVCPKCGYYNKRLVVSPKPRKGKGNKEKPQE